MTLVDLWDCPIDPSATGSVSAAAHIPEVGRLLIVTGTSVNMRSGPSTTWEVIGNLRRGAKAELVAQADGGWLQIRDVVTGRVGYMAGRFLEPFQE